MAEVNLDESADFTCNCRVWPVYWHPTNYSATHRLRTIHVCEPIHLRQLITAIYHSNAPHRCLRRVRHRPPTYRGVSGDEVRAAVASRQFSLTP